MKRQAGFQATPLKVLPILTGKQVELLVFLNKYFIANRNYPTQREIATHFGVTPTAAGMALSRLHKKGYLVKLPGERRNIRLTGLALEKLHLMGERIGQGALELKR